MSANCYDYYYNYLQYIKNAKVPPIYLNQNGYVFATAPLDFSNNIMSLRTTSPIIIDNYSLALDLSVNYHFTGPNFRVDASNVYIPKLQNISGSEYIVVYNNTTGKLSYQAFTTINGGISQVLSGTNIKVVQGTTIPVIHLEITSPVDCCGQSLYNVSSLDFLSDVNITGFGGGHSYMYSSSNNLYIDASSVDFMSGILDNISTIQNTLTIDTVGTIQNVDTITDISNIQNIGTIQNVTTIDTVDTLQNINSINSVYTISDISFIQNVSTIEGSSIYAYDALYTNLISSVNVDETITIQPQGLGEIILQSSSATSNITLDNSGEITMTGAVINIGDPASVINMFGTVNTVETTNLQIFDPLITLNRNGSNLTALGSGIEIEANGSITGYIKTDSVDGTAYKVKLPGSSTIYNMMLIDQSGNIDVSGVAHIVGPLDVSGATTLSGALNVTGLSMNVSDALSVTHIGGAFDVSGVTILSGITHIGSAFDVSGQTILSGGLDVSGGLNISGAVDVSGGLGVSGATHIGSVFDVSGYTMLSSGLGVSGAVDVSGALRVSNRLDVSNGLYVSGLTTLYNGLDVSGQTTFSGTSINVSKISSITHIGGAFDVSGTSTFSGISDFNNTANFNANVKFNSLVDICNTKLLNINPITEVVSYESKPTYTAPLLTDTNNVISIQQSSATTNGYLASGDWAKFNNVLSTLTFNAPLTYTNNVINLSNVDLVGTNGYLSSTQYQTITNSIAAATGVAISQVYYVAMNGNDTSGNGSVTSPFATIQKAINQCTDAAKYYTIYIAPHAYTESPTIGASISPRISIIGLTNNTNSKTVTITGTFTIAATTATGNETNNVIAFKNLTIQAATGNAINLTGQGFSLFVNNTNLAITGTNTSSVLNLASTSQTTRYYFDNVRLNNVAVASSNHMVNLVAGQIWSITNSDFTNANTGGSVIYSYDNSGKLLAVANSSFTNNISGNVFTIQSNPASCSLINTTLIGYNTDASAGLLVLGNGVAAGSGGNFSVTNSILYNTNSATSANTYVFLNGGATFISTANSFYSTNTGVTAFTPFGFKATKTNNIVRYTNSAYLSGNVAGTNTVTYPSLSAGIIVVENLLNDTNNLTNFNNATIRFNGIPVSTDASLVTFNPTTKQIGYKSIPTANAGTNIGITTTSGNPTISVAITSTLDLSNQGIIGVSYERFAGQLNIQNSAQVPIIYTTTNNLLLNPSGGVINTTGHNIDMSNASIVGIASEVFTSNISLEANGVPVIYTTGTATDIILEPSVVGGVVKIINGHNLDMTGNAIINASNITSKSSTDLALIAGNGGSHLLLKTGNTPTTRMEIDSSTIRAYLPLDMSNNYITNASYLNFASGGNISIQQNGVPRIYTTANNLIIDPSTNGALMFAGARTFDICGGRIATATSLKGVADTSLSIQYLGATSGSLHLGSATNSTNKRIVMDNSGIHVSGTGVFDVSGITSTVVVDASGNLNIGANKFTVEGQTGNMYVGGTMDISGVTTIALNGNKLVVDTTGTHSSGGILDASGSVYKNTLSDASGNVYINGVALFTNEVDMCANTIKMNLPDGSSNTYYVSYDLTGKQIGYKKNVTASSPLLLDGNNNLTYDYTANATFNNATTQINSTSLIGLSGDVVDICGVTAVNISGPTNMNGNITSSGLNTWSGKNQFSADVSFNSLVEFTNNARMNTAKKLYFKTDDTTSEYITYDLNSTGNVNGMIMNTLSSIELRQNNFNVLSLSNSSVNIFQNLSLGTLTNNVGGNTGLQLFGSGLTSDGIKQMTITQRDINASVGYKNWQMGPNGNNYNFFTTDDTYGTANTFLSFERKAGGAGVGKMIITSDYVGIGSASPAYKLDVGGDTRIGLGNYFLINLGQTGVGGYRSAYIYGDGTNMEIANQNNGYMKFHTNNAERMRITASGDVGIGTASPSDKLDVFGNIKSKNLLLQGDGTNAYIRPTNAGSGLYLGAGSTTSLTITESIVAPAGGKLTLSDSSTYQTVGFKLDNTSVANSGFQFSMTGSAGWSDPNIFGIYSNRTGDFPFILNGMNGRVGLGILYPSYQFMLSLDQAAKPSTTTWITTSDERIKTNIEIADISRCYDIIKSIPLKRYTWRDNVYTTEQVKDRSKLGWIAQDVETVFPKAVNIKPFKYNQKYDSSHNLISEDVIEDCRDLNADQLYAAMYGAIQSLIERNENKDVAIQELKNENASLKSRLTESENTLTQQVTINNNTLTAQVETLTSQVATLTSSVAAIKKLFNL